MRYDGADEELENFARELSPYAYRLVEEQYLVSKDRKTHYKMEDLHTSMYVLTNGDAKTFNHVDTSVRSDIQAYTSLISNFFLLIMFCCIFSDIGVRACS
ncbi:hypothetical protein JG687_00010232 [Phytophthora cactorum]|uniref:Uncharacterized protein n=1 Tax=Phytophthora cactorum TaxID=29920 RepID=A0A8T1U936_9STRA|nr:hypothetical protein JG687_00010232 [Phytophthora cactorum]